MGTRTCHHCGTFVPVSKLRCHECKQLLPSMLQRAHDPESPRPMYDPDRISVPIGAGPGTLRGSAGQTSAAGAGKLSRLLQSFGRK